MGRRIPSVPKHMALILLRHATQVRQWGKSFLYGAEHALSVCEGHEEEQRRWRILLLCDWWWWRRRIMAFEMVWNKAFLKLPFWKYYDYWTEDHQRKKEKEEASQASESIAMMMRYVCWWSRGGWQQSVMLLQPCTRSCISQDHRCYDILLLQYSYWCILFFILHNRELPLLFKTSYHSCTTNATYTIKINYASSKVGKVHSTVSPVVVTSPQPFPPPLLS